MFLIKFGGSVITDKAKECCFKQDVVNRLAAELKRANKEAILVHGAGSFGHILAKRYTLNEGFKEKKQLHGFALTHAMVQKLNSLILASLHDQGLDAVSIPPHAMMTLNNHQPARVEFSLFKEYLTSGFLPVTFGDVVLDGKLGFSICSGDLLMQLLAAEFKPEKVIFVLDEDGLYSANPKSDPKATFIETATLSDLEKLTTRSDPHADVTKGMEGKIETIKKIAQGGVDTILLNGNIDNRLYDTLIGKTARYTLIKGEGV
jgi:isopentenyl phosphate kinase